MLAFFYDKFTEWTYSGREPEKVLTRDEMLDNVTLYWLTNTGTSSSRSYWDAAQGGGGPFNAVEITKVPVAVTIFPGEIYRAPRSWAEQSFHKLIYWNEVDKGGHFAAWEQPELFAGAPGRIQVAAPSLGQVARDRCARFPYHSPLIDPANRTSSESSKKSTSM